MIFSNLRILSDGWFLIKASSLGIASVNTSAFSVRNYAYSIDLSSTTLNPSANFTFNLTASIYAEDGKLFNNSCVLTLNSNSNQIFGTNSLMTSTGISIFQIYFNSVGQNIITCTCPVSGLSPQITKTITINVLTEILKLSFGFIVSII